MFKGEMASLESIGNTETVRVPKPIKLVTIPGTSCLVMEHLELRSCTSKQQSSLGEQLAR